MTLKHLKSHSKRSPRVIRAFKMSKVLPQIGPDVLDNTIENSSIYPCKNSATIQTKAEELQVFMSWIIEGNAGETEEAALAQTHEGY